MKEIINLNEKAKTVRNEFEMILPCLEESIIMEPFYSDFQYKFCWNSNSLEGNTLTLDETIQLIEYDEVRSGHTYTEYEEAKRLYRAINDFLDYERNIIDEKWIKAVNDVITGNMKPGYRKEDVYIGNKIEAVYYPPSHDTVEKHMKDFLENINDIPSDMEAMVKMAALKHIEFERIHPFVDGNGRSGRMLLNQMLINGGLLPVVFDSNSQYRQCFRRYDRNKDTSMLEYLIYKGEQEAIDNLKVLKMKYVKSRKTVKIK